LLHFKIPLNASNSYVLFFGTLYEESRYMKSVISFVSQYLWRVIRSRVIRESTAFLNKNSSKFKAVTRKQEHFVEVSKNLVRSENNLQI